MPVQFCIGGKGCNSQATIDDTVSPVQKRLSSGLYKILMKDKKSLETRGFFSKNPLDETLIKKYEPGYELTLEYVVIKNKTTDKEEYFLKESGAVQSVGAVKDSNQQ